MKRSLSDSDSDDVFDDDGLKASSPSQSCQVSDRKKRRGIIEKRRRDRINCSLSELRRLVPTAFEKQGSAKLEKAEILQMTVDHLKMLHQKGINGYNYPDPQSLAMDYRAVGFRECAAEIARYLVTVEGMDLQDPLRMRLLGHLQCFSTQREVVSKTSISNQTTAWSAVGSTHHQYNAAAAAAAVGSSMHITQTSMLAAAAAAATQHHVSPPSMDTSLHPGLSGLTSSLGTAVSGASSGYSESRLGQMEASNSLHSHAGARLSGGSASGHNQMSVVSSSGGQGVQQISPSMISNIPPQFHSQFPTMSLNSMMSPSGAAAYSVNNSALNQSSVRPYRPWGAELAY